MFRLLLNVLIMKRAQKSTKNSQSLQTESKRLLKNGSNGNDTKSETVKRQTRSSKTQKDDKSDSSADLTPKIDLSQFEIQSKQKIKAESTNSKKLLKRQHVEVEYDENVPKDKFKKENNEETTDATTSTGTNRMPPNWKEVLQNLREMRKEQDAPVDTMGCDQCPDETASPKDKRFQSLLSLMLSSQTKDQVTHAAMLKLREHGCSLTNIISTSDEKLGELIYPVSFWKTKVKNIKRTSEMIRDTFDGDIPNTVEDLCKLPGVGPKMAHLCMKTAWGQITGIGVDTHVHRITNRLGWVKTKTPEDTRKALEGWLPHDLWSEVNHLLVGFGQQICQPVRPQCATCLNNQLCPFGRKEIHFKGKSK